MYGCTVRYSSVGLRLDLGILFWGFQKNKTAQITKLELSQKTAKNSKTVQTKKQNHIKFKTTHLCVDKFEIAKSKCLHAFSPRFTLPIFLF